MNILLGHRLSKITERWIHLPMERAELSQIENTFDNDYVINKFHLPFVLLPTDNNLHEINDTLVTLSTLDLSSSKMKMLYKIDDKTAEESNFNRDWRTTTKKILNNEFTILQITNKRQDSIINDGDIAQCLYDSGYINFIDAMKASVYKFVDWFMVWDIAHYEHDWLKAKDDITGLTYAIKFK